MTDDDIFLKFQWQDRCGLTWNVGFDNSSMGFSGFAASRHERGTGIIHVSTHDNHAQKQWMAFLNDVRVDSRIENRGLGSMLVRRAIEECIRRGHKGICGYLSDVDIGHFQQLKHFYKKLGFSVGFYAAEHPDYRFDRVGKIEMCFNNVRAES